MCKYVCIFIERAREMHILEYGIKWIYMYTVYCSIVPVVFPVVFVLLRPFKVGGQANPYNQFKVVGHHIFTVNHLGFIG